MINPQPKCIVYSVFLCLFKFKPCLLHTLVSFFLGLQYQQPEHESFFDILYSVHSILLLDLLLTHLFIITSWFFYIIFINTYFLVFENGVFESFCIHHAMFFLFCPNIMGFVHNLSFLSNRLTLESFLQKIKYFLQHLSQWSFYLI